MATKVETTKVEIPWACPKCQAPANKHGKGGADCCRGHHGSSGCSGFICECDDEGDGGHGASFDNVCSEAHCYHCGWSGTFPVKPKGLEAWEKKALEAGWQPPTERARQLGLTK